MNKKVYVYKNVCLSCSKPCAYQALRCRKCAGLLRRKSPQESLLEKIVVDEVSGCWNFSGQINIYGYGIISSVRDYARKRNSAHKISYEMHKGPVPDGLTIDHLCRNTRCVNPDHMEVVTNSENVRRANLVLGTPRQRKARRLSGAIGTDVTTEVAASRKSK